MLPKPKLTRAEIVAHIRRAADLLGEVRGSLDTREDQCTCCGIKKKADWDEAQASEALKGTMQSLHKRADYLERRAGQVAAFKPEGEDVP